MSLVSPMLLFLLLPSFCLTFLALPENRREWFLAAASLVTYFLASPESFFPLSTVIIMSWVAYAISCNQRLNYLIKLVVVLIILQLFFYKYSMFYFSNILKFLYFVDLHQALPDFLSGLTPAGYLNFTLPIGISFYSFQAISAIIDLKATSQKYGQVTFARIALYISFFPQLIAGPVVKFSHFYREITRQKFRTKDINVGLRLISIGLFKKLFIADFFAHYVDTIYGSSQYELSWWLVLLGPSLFFLQIYFDFSGYSDMAIGMSRLFGIRLIKNFKLPYRAKSITDFWRRWHVSLSLWFRNYVYIPLGGNRVSSRRAFFNLCFVFLLCGFWHGANWTFIVWGFLHGFFLILEKLFRSHERFHRLKTRCRLSFLTWVYTILVVWLGWAVFRANDLTQLSEFYANLVNLREGALSPELMALDFGGEFFFMCGLATVVMLGIWSDLIRFGRLNSSLGPVLTQLGRWVSSICIFAGGILGLSMVARGTFESFIYFQF